MPDEYCQPMVDYIFCRYTIFLDFMLLRIWCMNAWSNKPTRELSLTKKNTKLRKYFTWWPTTAWTVHHTTISITVLDNKANTFFFSIYKNERLVIVFFYTNNTIYNETCGKTLKKSRFSQKCFSYNWIIK